MSTATAVSSLLPPASCLRIESLRALLPALPQAPGLPTGLEQLDRRLATGGLPRGRLTEVVGTTGKLTLLRALVEAAVERGEWVAYIDASRTLAPRDWAESSGTRKLWIVRPPEPAKAAWCADVLLRSGSFAVVVLDSAPPISRAVAVRLTGLARESNAAFVVVGLSGATRYGGGGGAVRLRVHRRRHRLRIAIEKGARVEGAGGGAGSSRLQPIVEVRCANGVARRLCAYPEVPDRRGVQRETRDAKREGRRAATPDYARRKSGGMLRYC